MRRFGGTIKWLKIIQAMLLSEVVMVASVVKEVSDRILLCRNMGDGT